MEVLSVHSSHIHVCFIYTFLISEKICINTNFVSFALLCFFKGEEIRGLQLGKIFLVACIKIKID